MPYRLEMNQKIIRYTNYQVAADCKIITTYTHYKGWSPQTSSVIDALQDEVHQMQIIFLQWTNISLSILQAYYSLPG